MRAVRLIDEDAGAEEVFAAARAALAARDLPTAQRLLASIKRLDQPAADVDELEAEILLVDGSLIPAAELLERAAAGVDTDPNRAARLLATAATTLALCGRLEEADRVARAAQSRARGADGAARLRADIARGDAFSFGGRWRGAQELYRRAAREGERSGLAHTSGEPRLALVEAHFSCGDTDRARELALVAARESRADGNVAELTLALASLFSVEFVAGRIRPAAAAATEELEVAGGEGRLMERKEALGHLAWCAAHRGEADRCRQLVHERYELGERLGDDALLHPSLGVLELGLGDPETALAAFRRTLRTLSLRGHSVNGGAWIVGAELVEAELMAGNRGEAARLAVDFDEEAMRTERPHALSLSRRCRGLLAQDEAFDREFEAALAHDADEPRPLERARTVLCWGMRLRRARRRAEARERLKQARDELERLGSDLWAARARSELAATGERPRRREPSAGAELTERERHVAALVAEGLSNREIGERLFVTTNTVETHLRHIFQKRGVRSRTALVRSLGASR